tara:strand:+ start:300 stop:812 length:513 start_codon:yes stop_codon:yes gene_type:complete
MNIFYLHEDPKLAASYVYDKHKVKMILESAQMLCTAHHVYGNGHNVPYKQAHLNHPSTIWTRENTHHYYWLYLHMLALGDEYTKRYGKHHLSIQKCAEPLLRPPSEMPTKKFEQPPQCMPDEHKTANSVHAYWNYYINEKHLICNKNETPYTFSTIPKGVSNRYGIPCSC